jgi:RHS repeat-associated protein
MTDSTGKNVAQYTYDAWGNVLTSSAEGLAADNPFGYAGYMYDKEIGMYYLMARYYHPVHGVFISVDPDPGDADDPITQNGYTYVNNNPVMGVDPDGHVPWLVMNGGFAVYDGYKAYKSGANWKRVAFAGAKGFVGGGRYGAAKRALNSANYLIRPGKYARLSIPAIKGKSRNFSSTTRRKIDEIGYRYGCHSCGIKNPGTKSGRYIPDHQPANAIAGRRTQRLYPHCQKCSWEQAGRVSAISKKRKSLHKRR